MSIVAVTIIAGLLLFQPSVSLNGSHVVHPGDRLHVHGVNFVPGSKVTFTLDGHVPVLFSKESEATALPSKGALGDTALSQASVGARLIAFVEEMGTSGASSMPSALANSIDVGLSERGRGEPCPYANKGKMEQGVRGKGEPCPYANKGKMEQGVRKARVSVCQVPLPSCGLKFHA